MKLSLLALALLTILGACSSTGQRDPAAVQKQQEDASEHQQYRGQFDHQY